MYRISVMAFRYAYTKSAIDAGAGQGLSVREAYGVLDARPGGCLHRFDVVPGDGSALHQQIGKAADRVLVTPLGDLVGLAVGLGVADIVAAQAVREALDDGRALAVVRSRDGAATGFQHGQRVVAVDDLRCNAVWPAVRGHMAHDRMRRHRRELGVAVVLAHQDHRQLPQRRHVETFVEGTGIGGAIAEINRDHVTLFPRHQCRSERQRDRSSDDAGRGHQPPANLHEVHGAAAAAAVAGVLAGQFRQEQVRIGAAGEEMPV